MGFGKDGRGNILYESAINEASIGAIVSRDVIELTGSFHEALEEDFRMLKCDYWIAISPAQAIVVEDGPILVGLAAGNLAAGDIEGAIESIPLNQNHLSLENTNRPVWPLEMFQMTDPDAGSQSESVRKGSFNPKWTFNNPDGWTWWVYNVGAQTLTTGSAVTIFAKMYGMWLA